MEGIYPKNELEFLGFIEDIDNELKRRNVPIHARPLCAVSEACVRLKTSMFFVPGGPPIPGDYTGDSLSAHIDAWYQKKYGDRLKIDFSPGTVAILIRGDAWKVKFPLMYGTFKLVFGTFPDRDEKTPALDPGAVYPLRWIQGFTSDLSKSLNKLEMQAITTFLLFALQSVRQLRDVQNEPYLPAASADLEMAVSTLFLTHPNYGQSKWASLQFTEKLFKGFLTLKRVAFPKSGKKGHDLAGLAELSAHNGLPVIGPDIIKNIQCPPGVRYGEVEVDLARAIEAHHSSLEVCNVVCSAIRALKGSQGQAPPSV
jgi:hypothetical protein